MRKLIVLFSIYGLFMAVLFHIVPVKVIIFPALLFLVSGIFLAAKEYKDDIEELKRVTASRLEDYESKKKKLEEGISTEEDKVVELRKKELMMMSLYEITKKMSHDLTFNEIFGALSTFLKEHFIFKKSELLILKEGEGYIKVDRVYKLHNEPGQEEDPGETDYGDVLMLFAKDKKEVYFRKEENGGFGAIPLLSENKFVGILTVEGLPSVDFERFVIVATQFALEIKKVLLYETVEELAITDSLTGLYTRRYFFERLNEELARSRAHGFKFAFVMLDIDDFKKCNDTHGHLVGDVILKDVSRIIRENIREIDLVARYGGEEFSLILPETDRKGSMLVAERIRKRIEDNTFKAYDEKLKVTVSAGIAIFPDDASSSEDIADRSDQALYLAKSSGKNIVCEYKDKIV